MAGKSPISNKMTDTIRFKVQDIIISNFEWWDKVKPFRISYNLKTNLLTQKKIEKYKGHRGGGCHTHISKKELPSSDP